MADYALAGSGLPATDGGGDYIATSVSHFRAGNELWDREAGGLVRTVARVETVIRIHFEPMDGQPDHRDYRMGVPAEARQYGRRGVPAAPGTVHRSQGALEGSWGYRDAASADGTVAYPDPDPEGV